MNVKVAHTRLPSVGIQSWSPFMAVGPQVTWVINICILVKREHLEHIIVGWLERMLLTLWLYSLYWTALINLECCGKFVACNVSDNFVNTFFMVVHVWLHFTKWKRYLKTLYKFACCPWLLGLQTALRYILRKSYHTVILNDMLWHSNI